MPLTGKKPKSTELRTIIARRLKAARRATNENATEIARILGIAKQTLFDYETGRTYPDELFLVRFHEYTGCPLDWIFLGKITAEMPPEMVARIAEIDPELIAMRPKSRTLGNSTGGAGAD